MALRRAYNRKAYPGLYYDPRAVDRHLANALRLPGLNDQQRASIEGILQEYRTAYERVSEQMIQLVATSEQPRGFNPAAWRASQARRNKLEVIRFERDEENAKALRRLGALLSEQQKVRIGLEQTGGE